MSTFTMFSGVAVSLFYKKRAQGLVYNLIFGTLILGFLLSLFKMPFIASIGFYLFALASFAYAIRCVLVKRKISLIISVFTLILIAIQLLNLPGLNVFRLTLLIPFVLHAITFKKDKKEFDYTHDYAINTILIANLLVSFFQLF